MKEYLDIGKIVDRYETTIDTEQTMERRSCVEEYWKDEVSDDDFFADDREQGILG